MSGHTKQSGAGKNRSFAWAIALLSVTVAACTATGSGTTPQLQAQGEALSLVDAMTSATETAENSASTQPESGNTVLALADTKSATPAEQGPAEEAATAENAKPAAAASDTTGEVTASAPVPPTSPPAANAAASAADAPQTAESNAQAAETQAPATKVQTASLSTSPRQVAFATPASPVNRSSQSGGTIMRLFSDNRPKKNESAKILDNSVEKKAVVASAASKASGSTPRKYNDALPGVRENFGIEIKRRTSMDDDSDIDAHEEDEAFPIQLASAGGLARLAPNGLKKQRESVDVACLKPQLVALLKTVERHFRRPVMITSGYRSPSHNRAVNGARRSLHMMCAAADIQIDGVSKWDIARYVRSMPNRGGVGTYCHTSSVHIDIGPERDWNWRCVRRG
ncbi:DUF882 domain-containing protein [Phyllobacterium salinisoli]|uniref:Murein endopeptidase K n=1 Tax=Phyllobacterium salinisoli TaxID=1899321 RepID=A0A368K443_9HYPH|nr:YcbK family protein [Phyllobacterium salinisoli]RCS24147.1 DUF882 domain-containing protein [Phyllobacterium salinisoli]